jgi:predicted ATPase/DNA-binding CsgD family transcriptional regulator
VADPTTGDRQATELIPLVPLRDQGRLEARLPVQLTSFIGREREIEQVCALLLRDDVRLLTLTGPGGIGKTRLSLRVAEEIKRQFADGVVFIPLASVVDPDLVVVTIAQALGVRETSDQPSAERLTSILRDRHLLLVLDNFEHVLPAATVVTCLLTECPRLTVLVTSRASLQVSGEHKFPVPSLRLPGHEGSMTSSRAEQIEAIWLFTERARSALPNFELNDVNAAVVADICWRLDGLPLAIELAAARVDILPPTALLARLEKSLALLTGGPMDAPVRLRSMRDAIAWSYDLLAPEEQLVFRRLAVFVGGCTLDAAEAVVGTGADAFEGIASLVNKSLLRQEAGPDDEPRHVMLETVREFALERLAEADETEATYYAHATYYLNLAQRAETAYFGPAEAFWFTRLETELANFRAALLSLAAQDKTDDLARLASALCWFWRVHGHVREGAAWLNAAAEMSVEVPPPLRAQVLIRAGYLADLMGEDRRAVDLLESGIALAREIGDKRSLAEGQVYLSDTMAHLCEFKRSAALSAQAQVVWKALNEPSWITRTFLLQALVSNRSFDDSQAKEEYARATEAGEQALALARSCGFTYGVTNSLILLAGVGLLTGDHRRAASLYAESLIHSHSVGDTVAMVDCFARLAQITQKFGDGNSAARLVGATEVLREALGVPIDPITLPDYELTVTALRAELGESAFDVAFAAGRSLTLEEAKAEALTVPLLGDPALSVADSREANLGLSPRELEVLRLIAAGRTDKEIANELFVARRTVTTHVQNILNKLGVDNRAAAAAYAGCRGLT